MAKQRPNRRFTNDEKVKILQAHLTPHAEGRWPATWAQVRETLKLDPKVHHSILHRAARAAIEEGLVEIKSTTRAWSYKRAEDLEDKIKQKFKKLHQVVVIEPIAPLLSGSAAESDEIHELLGRAAAKALDCDFFFADGGHIGAGGGRAVYRFAHAFAQLRKQEMKVVLSALTGSLLASNHASATRVMDADANILLLREAFLEAHCRYVNYPLMPANLKLLKEGRKFTPLNERERYLDSAVIGAGVLSKGHKLYEWAQMRPDWVDKTLVRVHRWVQELASICDDYATRDYVPAGDVCNYLMFFPPPKRIPLADDRSKQIRKLITDINKRLLTISWPALIRIKQLALIAGGPGKAWAITSLARHPKLPIRFLCTDKGTAQQMCQDE